MRELRTYGSVRGAFSNERPYRDSHSVFSNIVRPAKGWHVQWEVSPTGERVGTP
jgi:hypothetical protein